MKLAAEQKIDPVQDMKPAIDLCLGCRACETACPVGVPYGHILEAAKEEIYRQTGNGKQAARPDKAVRFVLRHVFPYPARLRLLGDVTRLMQRTGLLSAICRSGPVRKRYAPLAQFGQAVPDIPGRDRRLTFGRVIPAHREKKLRVAFFVGCVMDALMFHIHDLSVKLLARIGIEVVVSFGQRCCGALHAHQGMTEEARTLAKANIAAFEQSEAEWIVSNAGGCGAALHEYGHLLGDDPAWAERAANFSAKTRDISDILWQYGPLPFLDNKVNSDNVVAYQPSCHLLHVQHVAEAPRNLIRHIPGVKLVEMKGADRCCGSGGIYNVLHYDESMAILDEKMDQFNRTGACLIVSGNPGCMLQLQAGIERQGLSHRAASRHLVELLADACGIS